MARDAGATSMGDFASDTTVIGGDGAYRANLSPDWEVWGPLGGYVAAIALRAMAAETQLPRPASFQCQFLSVARFDAVEVAVETLRRGKRSQALHARMTQQGRPVLAALGWFVDDGLSGLVHAHGEMPEVPPPAALRSYAELAEDYADWYPVWRTIDGKPVRWGDGAGPPVWHTWMRLVETPDLSDPFLDAARTLTWMDIMMWNAAATPHLPWPLSHIAPSLDLSLVFHDSAPDDEWLLCDGHAPVARHGLAGCTGRVWTPSGRLLASGTSTLVWRPAPAAEPG
jgi:acyl-CoA thioesterase II